jgi:hypothetical protein
MAGKKTFVAGEVLTAQDVNDYLMDQSVMNFASSAARSSAIPTPTEGMTSYVADDKRIEAYDADGWRPKTPFAMAAGKSSVSMSAVNNASVTVTFPASRFTDTPVVNFTPRRVGAVAAAVFALRMATVTTSSAQFTVVTRDGSNITETIEFNWVAVQMTSASASG